MPERHDGQARLSNGSASSRSVRVTIAGGGIGGMALALSLYDAGFHEVDVYESAPTVKEFGVGIDELLHAARELAELGLLLSVGGRRRRPPVGSQASTVGSRTRGGLSSSWT